MSRIFYQPGDAWSGDYIPYYEDGTYYLFYLKDYRDAEKYGEGMPWFLVTTEDFVHFQDRGEVIPRGGADEKDLYIFTGSVFKHQDTYHIFYTGHNPHMREKGEPEQVVMHAVSGDLLHWTKRPQDTFCSPAQYEPHDWRDPFVYWDEEKQRFHMLLVARKKDGPSRRRGVTALCSSRDLESWTVEEEFWDPGLYYAHECPDLFCWNGWWYLLYSTFSQRGVTHYRMARSPQGPWQTPEQDDFDGHCFYAAKSFQGSDGRYLFGWLPTREGNKDEGSWQWGGHLVVHQMEQNEDGTLRVRMPDSVCGRFDRDTGFRVERTFGNVRLDGDTAELSAAGSYAAAWGSASGNGLVECTFTFEEGTRSFGLSLYGDDEGEGAYYVRLEPGRNRMVFDKWPRKGEYPFYVETERFLELMPGKEYTLKVLVEDSSGVAYVNDQVAMGFRMYEPMGRNVGIFGEEGRAVCSAISFRKG